MRKVIVIVLLFLPSLMKAQYLPSFSTFMDVGLLYNPSLAGVNDNLSALVGFRSQWMGIEGAPRYLFFSADLPSKRQKVGIGVNLLNESIGINNNTLVNGNFSYKFLLSKGLCTMGISLGAKNARLDQSRLELVNNYDPAFNNIANNVILPFAGFGMNYEIEGFSVNVAFMDLINNSYSRNLNLMAKYKYQLNDKLLLNSYVFYKKGLAAVNQMEIGSSVEYNRKLGFYFGYRTNQDLILGLSINISKQLYMIYSYDFTARFFSDFSNGSNDLVLRFNFIEEKKAYSPKDF